MYSVAQELAEAFDRLVASGQPNLRLDEHWAQEFQTSIDSPDLLLAMSAMHLKLKKVQGAVNDSSQPDRAKTLYLSALSQLEPFVNGFKIQQHNVNQVKQLSQQVDILNLAAASLPADLVPSINDLTIDALVKELEDLLADIVQSSLPEDFKASIKIPLETLLMAIRSYRILGVEGVTRIYGAAAAEIARIDRSSQESPAEAKSKIRMALDFAKKAGAAIVWVGAVVSAAHGVLEDGSSILGLNDQAENESEKISNK